VPLVLVVAFCVVLLPFGPVSVNVTLAPEADIPPLLTDAVIETVLGGKMVVALVATLTARVGGAITVAFATADPVDALVDAFKFTA
jgi:hypothetical protein